MVASAKFIHLGRFVGVAFIYVCFAAKSLNYVQVFWEASILTCPRNLPLSRVKHFILFSTSVTKFSSNKKTKLLAFLIGKCLEMWYIMRLMVLRIIYHKIREREAFCKLQVVSQLRTMLHALHASLYANFMLTPFNALCTFLWVSMDWIRSLHISKGWVDVPNEKFNHPL